MSTKKLFVSPLTFNVKITLGQSIVAATTFESEPDAPDIVMLAPVASAVSPTSMSKSLDEPTQIIEAVTVAHDELDPPLSQLKSMLLLLPVVLNVPVYDAPFISKVNAY